MTRSDASSPLSKTCLILAFVLPYVAHAEERTTEGTGVPQQKTIDARALLGSDEDADGVRDDLETQQLMSASTDSKQASAKDASVADHVARAFASSTQAPTPPQRTCFDFLLLEPKQQYDAELTRRSLPNQFEGAHPCDPVVPPLYNSPLDTPYAQVSWPPSDASSKAHDTER